MPTAISSLMGQNPSAPTGGGSVNKNDFLKLLVAQLSHQDPLAPQTDTAFVAQLAQFAQLEQSQNQTAALEQLASHIAGQAGTQAVGLIGQTVTARYETIAVSKPGKVDPINYTLDADASSVTLKIYDSKGTALRTIKTEAQKAGIVALPWDGKGDDGNALPQGDYRIEVSATGTTGTPVSVRPEVRGLCTGVTYENGRPELILPGGIRIQLADVIQVTK